MADIVWVLSDTNLVLVCLMRFQFKHSGLFCCTQAFPYNPVQSCKDHEGDDGRHGDPGPGGVEHDVVP